MTRLSKRSFSSSPGLRLARALAVLSGCSKEEKTTTTATPAGTTTTTTTTTTTPMAASAVATPASGPLKIAFAYVGPVGDGGWTFAHDNARKAIEKEFGAKIQTSFVENVPEAADAERVFRDMASQGNKLIFGTTFGYMEPMLKVAGDTPDVKFEHATGYKQAPNMRTYDSRTYEGAYMAGVIAGGMTKTNTLGVVGSVPIPEVVRNINSFTMGAQSVNPNVKTKVVWVNKWFDPPNETRRGAVAHQRRRRRADAEHRLVGGAADGGQGRQVRLRLGQRHDRVRAERAPRVGGHQLGAVLQEGDPGRARRHAGRAAATPGGASRKARSTSSRSPRRCRPTSRPRSRPSRPA